jgi:hypothetical protein
MITHFTAAVAEERRNRWMAEARVADAARLARQARRSDRPARTRVSARWLLARIHRRAIPDPATATTRPVLARNPQSLPHRTGDLSNRLATAPAGQPVIGPEPAPTGNRR